MADRDAWEQPLYRFAYLLLRDGEAARKVVLETLEAGILKRPSHIDPERLIMLQFRDARRRILKGKSATSGTRTAKGELPNDAEPVARAADLQNLEHVIYGLPEPGRTAYALLLLDALESEWIAKLLGLPQAEFAETVQTARLAVHQALIPRSEPAA